jgi:hypothetical protein
MDHRYVALSPTQPIEFYELKRISNRTYVYSYDLTLFHRFNLTAISQRYFNVITRTAGCFFKNKFY